MVAYRNEQFGSNQEQEICKCIFCGDAAASIYITDDGRTIGMCLGCLVVGPVPRMVADGIAEVRSGGVSMELKDRVEHDIDLFNLELCRGLLAFMFRENRNREGDR